MNKLVENISFWAHAELRSVSKIVIEFTLQIYCFWSVYSTSVPYSSSDIATYSCCRHCIIRFNFGIKRSQLNIQPKQFLALLSVFLVYTQFRASSLLSGAKITFPVVIWRIKFYWTKVVHLRYSRSKSTHV